MGVVMLVIIAQSCGSSHKVLIKGGYREACPRLGNKWKVQEVMFEFGFGTGGCIALVNKYQ